MKQLICLRFIRLITILFLLPLCKTGFAQVQKPKYVSIIPNTKAYYEYLPEGYSTSTQTYPLILFIHGIESLGDGSASQLPKVLNNGLPKLISSNGFPKSFIVNEKTYRFIVIAPQFIDWPTPADIDSVLNYLVSHYRVDKSRIYLTGQSMGGGAVWAYSGENSTYAKRIAAIVPVCGSNWPDMTRSRTIAAANLPVWATHNNGDPVVSVAFTTQYVANINQAPAPNPMAKKTIFTSISHDAWTKTYNPNFKENNANIYEWMLKYQRGSTTTNQAPKVYAGNDQNINLPSTSVTLSGSATDADGTINSYLWSKVSGPSAITFSAAGSAKTTAGGLINGTYLFSLKATDNKAASGSDTVKVSVNALPASSTSNCGKQFKIVVLGSSSAYGKGATPIDSSWVNKYTTYVKSKNSQSTVINLAVPGYSTYEVLCPNNFVPPSGRPSPDTLKNITKALSINPDAIIINLPTNDIGYGYTLTEIKNNYERTMALANKRHIPVWITTSQPRTNFNQAERDSLKVLRDWTFGRFGPYTVDFWSTIANSDGSINSFYNSGDGVHVNNAGHQLFYKRIIDENILDSLCLRSSSTNTSTTTTKYIKVNIYGGSNAYSSPAWNNWNVGTAEKTNISTGTLKYSDGSASAITAVLSHSLSVGDNGAAYSSTLTSKMAPAEVLRYTSYSAQARTLTLSGLSTSKKYNVELYDSRYSTGNSTILSVNGITQTINAFDNYTNKGVYTNLTPNLYGQIVVTIKPGSTYSHLNGFMLTVQGSDYTAGAMSTKSTAEKELTVVDKQVAAQPSFSVFPNPVQDQLSLQLNNSYKGVVKVQFIDMNGHTVKEMMLAKNQQQYSTSFSIDELARGSYLISVKGENWRETKKIIKQ